MSHTDEVSAETTYEGPRRERRRPRRERSAERSGHLRSGHWTRASTSRCRFGGVVSLRDVSIQMRRGEILADHRAQRCGQDVALQLTHRCLSTPRRGIDSPLHDRARRRTAKIGDRQEDAQDRPGRRVADLSVRSRAFSALNVFENIKIGASRIIRGHRTRGLSAGEGSGHPARRARIRTTRR